MIEDLNSKPNITEETKAAIFLDRMGEECSAKECN